MNDEAVERVGFRDIYRAVGESESRIKEHITLVLLPLTSQMADHEVRIRTIEETGSAEAQEAAADVIALATRVSLVEAWQADKNAAGVERRRLGDLSGRALGAIILGSNFILGLIIMFANLITDHAK